MDTSTSPATLWVRNDANTAWIEVGGGGSGSLPDGLFEQTLMLQTNESATPTEASLDANTARAAAFPLLANGWEALKDYVTPFYAVEGSVNEIVQFLKPAGTVNYFAADISGGSLTGAAEPDWDVSAPNVGDSVVDDGVTWYNIGPAMPVPAAWQAGHTYNDGDMIWPTVPNGHVFVAVPGYQPGDSDAVEPDWTTWFDRDVGGFPFNAQWDNNVYWWDAGPAVTPTWERVQLPQEWWNARTGGLVINLGATIAGLLVIGGSPQIQVMSLTNDGSLFFAFQNGNYAFRIDGTTGYIRFYGHNANVEVMRITPDGEIHIRTGKTILADL